MNAKPLPPIITAAAMREHAPKGETHAVRILLLNSVGATIYTLRGQGRRKGKYQLEKSGASGRHQLDIPVSLWNAGIPNGRYTDNPSIAHDLLSRPNPAAPFSMKIVPWNGADISIPEAPEGSTAAPDFLTPLKALMQKIGAPPIVEYALSLAAGDNADALQQFVDSVSENPNVALPRFPGDGIDDTAQPTKETAPAVAEKIPDQVPANQEPQPKPAKSETPAARRMREKRERDKAKKAAAKQLQTA